MNDRIPPQNLEAESYLLGAMMVDRDLVPWVTQHVGAEDFYAQVNGTVFASIVTLFGAGQPTDRIAVAADLGNRKMLEKCGGLPYLSSLLDVVVSAASAEYFAKIVAEKAVLRRLIGVGSRIQQLGYDGEWDVPAAIAGSESLLREAVSGRASGDTGTSMPEGTLEAYRALQAASQGTVPGITSPWPQFDLATGRTFPGELVVWAAAPGVGKSIVVAQLALHVAAEHGAVALFALEMGTASTVRRLVGKYAGISSRRIRLGDVRNHEWERVSEAVDVLQRLPLRIFDRVPRKSVADVRRCLARMAYDVPVLAVVIDHANFLAEATNNSRTSKTERLDDVYKGLLEIASEFRCVVHVVQHLNRAGMDGEPHLLHLRDGGNLEGHANIVVFPYRPNMTSDPTNGEFIIAKNREYDLRKIPMHFDGAAQEWREADVMGATGAVA